MCGRFSLKKKTKKELLSRFHLKEIPTNIPESIEISPGQNIPVVLNESPEKLSLLCWGLVPSWANDESIGFKTFNARAETIFEKPAFKDSIRRRRCLIVADGFYEWKKIGKEKQGYRFSLKGDALFSFAGIWDTWRQAGREIQTCSIITTEPNALIAPVHDRMPVILKEEEEEQWLAALREEEIEGFLKPYPSEEMEKFEFHSKAALPKTEDLFV